MRERSGQLLPQLPDLEVLVPGRRVVEKHDTARANLGKPVVEVVADGLVRVESIDVEQIDGFVAEVLQRVVECSSKQFGERTVGLGVVLVDLIEYGLVVEPGVRVTLPCVDCVTCTRDRALLHRLTHAEIGFSIVRAQLHEQRWLEGRDQVRSELKMP